MQYIERKSMLYKTGVEYFELLNYKGALRKYSVTLFTAEKKKLNFRAIRATMQTLFRQN